MIHFSSCRGVFDTTLCDKVFHYLRQVDSFLSFSCTKTDRHDINEILLKVALNTITLPPCSLNIITNVLLSAANISRPEKSTTQSHCDSFSCEYYFMIYELKYLYFSWTVVSFIYCDIFINKTLDLDVYILSLR